MALFRSVRNCNPFIHRNRVDLCNLSLNDYVCQFKKLFDIGPIYDIIMENGTIFCTLVECIAEEIYKARKFVCDLALEANPCTAQCPESLKDWAKVYGIYECLEDCGGVIPLTPDLICKIAENRGQFTCDWIKCLAEFEGYNVLDCEVCCETCPAFSGPTFGFGRQFHSSGFDCLICETSEQPKSGTGFGMFPFVSGRTIEVLNTECERAYAEYPCITCCPSSQLPATLPFEINCEEISRQAGGCSNCRQPCTTKAHFPYTKEVVNTTKKSRNRSVLKIKIEGPPPCPAPAGINYGFGRSFYAFDNVFNLCLLETQIPAHLCVKYEFSEDAC